MKPPADPTKSSPIVKFDIDKLDLSLAREINQQFGGGLTGEVQFTAEQWKRFPDDLRARVEAALKEGAEAEQRTAEAAAEKQRQTNAQIEALNARIALWIRKGMANSKHNADALLALADEDVRFKYHQMTPELLDVAIEILRREGKLEWSAPQPVTPTPLPPPVVRRLDNGEAELPIDALQTGAYHGASKAQLQDLSRRLGEGQSWFSRVGRAAGDISTDSSRRSGTSQVR